MLDKKYLGQLKSYLLTYAKSRLEVIELSNQGIHHAKRAIFALHRDDRKEAEEKLKQSGEILKSILNKYKKNPEILDEGAYKAGVEEFVEATLFYNFLTTGKIGEVKGLQVPPEVYVGGLCDVPGELYRYAIKSATVRDLKMTKQCAVTAQEIIGELIEFNLTSYLRTKFDQAKQAVQKLEQVVYEVSIRE
jgi:predicted translin family RNA/ssDNA-binding protein